MKKQPFNTLQGWVDIIVKDSMPTTKAKVKTDAEVETAVRGSVKAWAKAEDSAIWSIIREIHLGVWGLEGNERSTRENALRTIVINSIEEEFGEGASKANKRGAHISKMFTIGLKATPDHFVRWRKAGTGFYKAYEEFAKPQESPAAKSGSGVEPTRVTSYTDPKLGSEEKTAEQNKKLEDPDWSSKADQEASGVGAKPAGKGVNGAAKATNPTPNWATMIEKDGELWGKLMDALEPALTIEMVMQAWEAFCRKKSVKLRNVVEQLMQEPEFGKLAFEFIRDNPTIFSEEVGVEEEA